MKRPAVKTKNVLVTGCSTGIGLATARLLRERGWNVIPTARKDEDLAKLRAEGFTPVRLDVTDEASVTAAVAETMKLFGGVIGALVNNAGYGQAAAAEDHTRATLDLQMNTNFIGPHDLTTRFIPAMRRQGWGRIVNVSSVLGFITIPFYGAYCASKYAMEALTDAMRLELTHSGIGVSLIEPGPIETNFRPTAAAQTTATMIGKGRHFEKFYERELQRRATGDKKPNPFTLPPESCAAKILHALESARPKPRYRVTIPTYFSLFATRFLPACILDAVRSRGVPRD